MTAKQNGDYCLIKSGTVVCDRDQSPAAAAFHIEPKLRHALGVLCGVIQKVHYDLLNEHRVNIHHQRLIGDRDLEIDIRVAFFEIGDALAEYFLDKLRAFLYVCLLRAAYARYRKQVLHHSHEPFRVLLCVAQKLDPVLMRKVLVLIHDRVDNAYYRGQRCAQIM